MRNQNLKISPPLLRSSRGVLEGLDLEEVDPPPPNMDEPFGWKAPDLKYGGEWFEARLNKLGNITQGWHDQDDVMIEGRRLLASHNLNYTSLGAERLYILWWEWPPEHWDSLRFGVQ
jgi:hypothetical protein